MQIKKLALVGAAATLVGGLALAPNAVADENPPAADGHCAEIEGTQNEVVGLYGESPEEDGQGCLVAEGKGAVPVNPVDGGHIGIYDGGDTPALYGDCSPREDGAGFTPWEPTAEGNDTSACEPALNG
jgi:hypothetical protein